MDLTLAFSRKCRWPEHSFSVWSLGNSQNLLTTNQFIFSSQYNIFYNYEYLLFQAAFWSLFNHRPRIQSNQEQFSVCCSLPCFLVLMYTHYGPLQCFSTHCRKLKEIRLLLPIFPNYVISCNYDFNFHFVQSFLT